MKSIGIITDSTSSITPAAAEALGIQVLPMPFYIDSVCHYENAGLSRGDFFACQAAGKDIHTSQPSPEEVTWQWDHALKEYKHILYFPISSGLSGSYATACVLAQEHPYAGRVFVVDAGRVSTLLHQSILDALQLIDEGYKAEEIKDIIEKSRADFSIYIAVEQLDSLRRGGRISSTAAALGSLLGIKPVLSLTVGKLDLHQKVRGSKNARKAMIAAIEKDLETRFAAAREKGEVTVMIAGSADEQTTESWIAQIKEAFPGMPVLYDDLPLNICAHIGQGGLGIGLSAKPAR
ncbi:MAG: DegV family protein [Clostridia bacterium]|nr:DegV family protein [Clostridia bacterium]